MPAHVQKAAVLTVRRMCSTVNFTEYASRIIHPISRILKTGSAPMKQAAMQALCAFVAQLGSNYAVFIPMVNKILVAEHIRCVCA